MPNLRRVSLVALVLATSVFSGCSGGQEASPVTVPQGASPEVAAGAALARSRGCTACHTLDGGRAQGPTWQGIHGAQRTLRDGRTVTIDDAYLRRALVDPHADVPEGYSAAVMASVLKAGDELTDEEIDQLVAYIKTVE